MKTQTVFKRHELKYMLTTAQCQAMKRAMEHQMALDQFGRHTIHNIYFDTDDFLLIRRSIEKPHYKEKLRVRSYGEATEHSQVFVEVKKKFDGIVYKRRMELPHNQAYKFLLERTPLPSPTQISKEISYFMDFYQNLKPKIHLHYEREAYYGLENPDFRMTLDYNIRFNLPTEQETTSILEDTQVLLEIKTAMGIPQWLLQFFAQQGIFKTSFSKYGTVYQKFLSPTAMPKIAATKSTGGNINVA